MSQVIIQNLKGYMQMRSINSRELAKRAAVKPSFIYDILSGKSANPSSVKLSQVARALRVTLNDLVESSYLQSDNDNIAESPFRHGTANSSPMLSLSHSQQNNPTVGLAEKARPLSYFNPQWLEQHTSSKPDQLELIEIDNDLMAPTLHKGDMVMIDCSKTTPAPPGLFAICGEFGLVIKRIELLNENTPHIARISSDNPLYGTIDCPITDIAVHGRVIWISKWV